MKYLLQSLIFTLLASTQAYANTSSGGSLDNWLHWFGHYHYIFVHFPIALIIMAGIGELLLSWTKKPEYNFTVNFLLVSAALMAIPTVLAGLSLEESGVINEDNPILERHKIFGFVVLTLSIIVVILRNWLGRRPLYLWSLFILFICVIITSYLGGLMAFGDYNLFPPFA